MHPKEPDGSIKIILPNVVAVNAFRVLSFQATIEQGLIGTSTTYDSGTLFRGTNFVRLDCPELSPLDHGYSFSDNDFKPNTTTVGISEPHRLSSVPSICTTNQSIPYVTTWYVPATPQVRASLGKQFNYIPNFDWRFYPNPINLQKLTFRSTLLINNLGALPVISVQSVAVDFGLKIELATLCKYNCCS